MNEHNNFDFNEAQNMVNKTLAWIWDNMIAFEKVSGVDLMKTPFNRMVKDHIKALREDIEFIESVEMSYSPKAKDSQEV